MRRKIIAGLAVIFAIVGTAAPVVAPAAPAQAQVSQGTHFHN